MRREDEEENTTHTNEFQTENNRRKQKCYNFRGDELERKAEILMGIVAGINGERLRRREWK